MSEFPAVDLIPKRETNALDFCEKYDGSNVKVGILDTGVDPGAAAISFMADGTTPKLLDVIDCTGSGDVDVSTVVNLVRKDDYCECEGLSGRTLRLPASWKLEPLPSDEEGTRLSQVKVGILQAFRLFPTKLKRRVQAERSKIFREQMQAHTDDLKARLADVSKPKTFEETRKRDDIQALLDVVEDKEWDEDPGPVFDCVVFWDGQDWRAVVDTTETGDLSTLTPMTDFDKERQFTRMGVLDQMNFAVHFYDDASILSIVSDASPHATHVAGITAAAEGERSGVAPQAQLVSFKIGDSRLGSMETGASLVRALIQAIRLKCDVINLSYGEGCVLPNTGRFIELANDLVRKYNITFVSSAGNNGPAISTVGAPGGTSSCCIGVAAYVSPAMMKAGYSMPFPESEGEGNPVGVDEEQHVGSTYTWSSVGPAADGDFGVNVTAPGGAITSVSNWCLQKSQLMNGTSMSSPHAAGCVALLISACKAEGVPYSPARIRRALENTATMMPGLNALQQGWGMIQVDKAFEYLKAHKDTEIDAFFEVEIENRSGGPRGIYLRQPDEVMTRQTFAVGVSPSFHSGSSVTNEDQRRLIDFEMTFRLEATESWVTAPKHFMLMNNGRSFKIEVDPMKLEPGVHVARVNGIDAGRVVFSVPITVVKPLPTQHDVRLGELNFSPAEVKRFFLVPPLGSTWMDVTIRDCRDANVDEESSSKLVVLHTVQLLPHAAYRDFECQKYFQLRPGQTTVTSIAVEEGLTTELVCARYWSTLGDTKVDVEIQFRGITPTPTALTIKAGDGGGLVRIQSSVADESVDPSCKLTRWMTALRPKTPAIVKPLGERDILPSGGKIYELILCYECSIDEKCSFTPRIGSLQGVLYDSALESQLIMIYDGEKKYLGTADAWPGSISVPKGPLVLRLQIRSDESAKLEKLSDTPLWIDRSMDNILLSVYSSKEKLMGGDSSFRRRVLRKGTSCAVYFAEPPANKLPNGLKAGDILKGTMTFGSGAGELPGSGRRPEGFPVSFVVGPKPEKPPSDPDVPELKDERDLETKIDEAVRDTKVSYLGKLTKDEKESGRFDEVYRKLETQYPDHLPLRMARLKYLDNHPKRESMLSDVVSAATSVIELIDQEKLAVHFGKKIDAEDPGAVKERKDMKEKKSALLEAYGRMALAYSDMPEDSGKEGFDTTVLNIKVWIDIETSDKFMVLAIEKELRAGRHGSALRLINKLLQKDSVKDAIKSLSKSELYAKRRSVFEKLGYTGLVERDNVNCALATPKAYLLF